jgi:hypothetical protein
VKPPSFKVPKEGKLPVTKIDAAVRQLETAITLWFFDGDPVSICTLTFAAFEIIRSLNKGFGGNPTILDGRSMRKEHCKEILAAIRSSPNFFKHAGKDPHETHFFPVKSLRLIILDAVRTYDEWKLEQRPIFETFRLWLWLTEPKSQIIPPDQAGMKRSDIDLFIRGGKQQFFNEALPKYTRRIAGGR